MPQDPHPGAAIVSMGLPLRVRVPTGAGVAIALQFTGSVVLYLVAIANTGAPQWYGPDEIESAHWIKPGTVTSRFPERELSE